MNLDEISSDWKLIAGLRLKLRPHISVHRHIYRGETWYLLHDKAAAEYYRFDQSVMEFIGRLNGKDSVETILTTLAENHPDSTFTHEEIIKLVAYLHSVDMLQGDISINSDELIARKARLQQQKWYRRLLSPMALKIPLADPDRFLSRLEPKLHFLFGTSTLFLWSLIVIMGVGFAVAYWDELLHHGVTRGTDPYNLLLLALIFPIIKIMHELGHAVATKRWGGEVHEVGFMLLVLIPVPYVDASASTVFNSKWQRITVTASGIMVEAFLAAIALFVWINIQPGAGRDIAFNVMVIGGVSTILFNGNPLLRFDGYYLLSDWIEIPNLASRANKYLGYLLKRYLFGLSQIETPVAASGERGWFVGYGLASFCYRIYISLVIALLIADQFFMLGVVLAIWALSSQLLYPLLKQLRYLFFNKALAERRVFAITVMATLLIVTALVTTLVPVPSWTQVAGIISLPEQAQVRAHTNGFIDAIQVHDGQQVATGELLYKTSNPWLPVELAMKRAKMIELEARKTAEMVSDPTQSGIIKEQIKGIQAEIDNLRQQMEQLQIRSPITGQFRVANATDLEGRFVKEGDQLGYISTDSELLIRVVVPQTAIDLVRSATLNVEARLASLPGQLFHARIHREVPFVGKKLPSLALGTRGGGNIAVDARDKDGLTAIDNIYFVDIELPFHESGQYIGSKVFVRFNHYSEPLINQWWRSVRQLFLARLET